MSLIAFVLTSSLVSVFVAVVVSVTSYCPRCFLAFSKNCFFSGLIFALSWGNGGDEATCAQVFAVFNVACVFWVSASIVARRLSIKARCLLMASLLSLSLSLSLAVLSSMRRELSFLRAVSL